MPDIDAKRLRHLLDAVVAVGSGLELPAMLERIVELAADLVEARYGALGVLDDSQTRLAQFITVGIDPDTHDAIGQLPEGHGILGTLIVDAESLRLDDLQEHADSYGFPKSHPSMKSFLGVPIRVADRVFGNLYLTEKIGAESFSEADEELVGGLAVAAGVAIENARLHARVAELARSSDRERIARDLHDTVIQRIFATGLSLQGTLPMVGVTPERVGERIEAAVDDLDETVRQIRSTIFALESTRSTAEGVRGKVLTLCRESSGALGFDPTVIFDGPLDAMVSENLALDLLATLREALTNVARHAHANQVAVSLAAADDEVVLTVDDDGVGLPADRAGPGRGLHNMAERAERVGGSFSARSTDRGTHLEWRAPLR